MSNTLAQAPIIDGAQSSSRGGSYPSSGGATSGQAEMYRQLQSLQEEVMQLRGIVEEQNHQLEALKQQSLERYMDLDRRLGGGAAAVVPAAAAAQPGSAGAAVVDAAAPIAVPPAAGGNGAAATPAEQEAYKQAYAKLKGQQYTAAIQGFNAFLKDYPSSELVPNAYYWLGELHLVESPQNLNAAEQSFAKLLSDFPQHTKAPDALYKQGKVAFLKGDKARSKKLMQRVIDEYGASGSTAPQLAKQFIDENLRK
ncbi:MAG: tol-pal system protein YbgF [Spongiibacteraceae bacterium]